MAFSSNSHQSIQNAIAARPSGNLRCFDPAPYVQICNEGLCKIVGRIRQVHSLRSKGARIQQSGLEQQFSIKLYEYVCSKLRKKRKTVCFCLSLELQLFYSMEMCDDYMGVRNKSSGQASHIKRVASK